MRDKVNRSLLHRKCAHLVTPLSFSFFLTITPQCERRERIRKKGQVLNLWRRMEGKEEEREPK